MSVKIFILAGFLLAVPVSQNIVDETPLDRAVRDVAKELRCTVCQNENVYDSNSKLAQQMRDLIRERLAQGETPQAVKSYFVSKYGDYILLEPRKQGMNWVIWLLPFVGLGVGGALLFRLLSRWRRTAETQGQGPPPLAEAPRRSPTDPSLKRKLEQELREMED